jgi:hypothetical protein
MRGPTIIGTGSPRNEGAWTNVEFVCECYVPLGCWVDADPHALVGAGVKVPFQDADHVVVRDAPQGPGIWFASPPGSSGPPGEGDP